MVAQEKMPQVREDGAYMYVDQMPVYPKGQEGIAQYLAQAIQYPSESRTIGVSGTVLVQFVIKKNGRMSQFKIVRSVDPLLDKEALRAVKSLPGRWIPGREKGKKVSVVYNIPVSFRLNKGSNPSSPN